MTPERWHQITEIFHAALARDAEGREAYLQEACRHDAALRAEVAQLLAGHHGAGSSFGETPLVVAAGPGRRLEAGTSLGPYRIDALLGAGGMGEVYRARDTRLDRTVAIKVLPAGISADPDRRARFEREAKTIAGLAHPHICTLHDVGEHDGMPYLVMELVEGETLAQRLDRGPMPLEQALRCGVEVASALDRAHREGIVHRDLKPGNVMLTKDGAKLLDFGVAKLYRVAGSAEIGGPTPAAPSTHEGAILGTLQYMAPEQLESRAMDARADIFAFGAVLYEMVAGRPPFEGDSQASLISAILRDQPDPLAAAQPLTPRELDRLVQTCLAKDTMLIATVGIAGFAATNHGVFLERPVYWGGLGLVVLCAALVTGKAFGLWLSGRKLNATVEAIRRIGAV